MKQRYALLILLLSPVAAHALGVTATMMSQPLCNYANGSIHANAFGGVPPYTYAWVGPNGFTASGEYVTDLEAGTYTVTATDNDGTQASYQVTLVTDPGYELEAYTHHWGFCPGSSPYGFFNSDQIYNQYGNLPPTSYTVNLAPVGSSGGEYIFTVGQTQGLPYTYIIEDGQGCTGTISGVANYLIEWPTVDLLAVEASCSDGNNGGFTLGIGTEGHGQWLDYALYDGMGNYVPATATLTGMIGEAPVIAQFTTLPPDDYVLRLRTTYTLFGSSTECSVPFWVTVPNDGGCGTVQGRVYADYDESCMQNSEPSLAGMVLEFTPGPYYATTDAGGNYAADLPFGSYTITQSSADFGQHCPPPPTVVDLTPTPPLITQNLADTALIPLDVSLAIASGAARPGFQLLYAIELDNMTPATTGAMTLTMNFDPAVTYMTADPTPTNVTGNTVTWDLSALSNFSNRHISIAFQVPPDIGLVGTVLDADATVTTTNADGVPANNTMGTTVTVTASLDPNDKSVLTSSRYSATQYFIGTDAWLDYTIRFQNTGNDTAFHVVVTDTLSADLDPATIQWGVASHTCTPQLMGTGVLKFSFFNILLPDSNVNEAASHGFVSFRIRLREPVLPGTVVSNAADIYFDFNPPVHTNDAVVTTEMSTGMPEHGQAELMLYPNPADEQVIITAADGMERIELLSTDGRLVRAQRASGRSVTMDISALPNGLYILRVHGHDQNVRSIRVTKQ